MLSQTQWWSKCLVQRSQRRQCLLETSTRACGTVCTPKPCSRGSRAQGSCSRTHLAAVAVLVLGAVGLALALAAALLVREARV